MENNQTNQEIALPFFNKPSLPLRIKSMVIDGIVMLLLMCLASLLLNSLSVESGTIRGMALLLILLYEPILVSMNRTVGQKIVGLKVRRYDAYTQSNEKTNIDFFDSIVRYLGKLFLGWISLLTIHSDNYGQAIHDKLGNSVMTIE